MAETSFPYMSIRGDRKYGDTTWRAYFRSLFTNGVIPSGANLAVTPGTGMNVILGTGSAYVDGGMYTNDANKTIPIDPADAVLNRIDRIVLRQSISGRGITAQVLKGTPGASPVAPTLTQTSGGTYEIARADVYVAAAVTSISAGAITDNILNTSVCGTATARTTFDLSTFSAQFTALLAEIRYDLSQIVIEAVMAHALTHATGGADALSPADIGAASLTNGRITPSEANSAQTLYLASHTLALTDAGRLLVENSASAIVVTIPTDASVAFPLGTEIEVCRWFTGAVSFAAESGVNLYAMNNAFSISGRFGSAVLKKVETNGWLICGALG